MKGLTVKKAVAILKDEGFDASCEEWTWSADRPVARGSRLRNPGKLRTTWRLTVKVGNGERHWLSGYEYRTLTNFVYDIIHLPKEVRTANENPTET